MYEIPQNYQEIRKRWDSFCQSVHPDAICQKIRVESAWRNPLKLSGNQKMLESTWCYAERLSLQIYIYMCWSLLCMTHHMLKGCCDLQVYNEKSNPFLKFACKSRHIIMSLWRKGLIRKCGDLQVYHGETHAIIVLQWKISSYAERLRWHASLPWRDTCHYSPTMKNLTLCQKSIS